MRIIRSPIDRIAQRSGFLLPMPCIFVSDMIRQRALKWIPWLSNTYVVHNGADDALFYPASPASRPRNPVPVVLFVGRLEPRKGVHVLIEAMRLLQQRKVDVRCRIIGESFLHGSKVTPYLRNLRENSPSNCGVQGFLPSGGACRTISICGYSLLSLRLAGAVWQRQYRGDGLWPSGGCLHESAEFPRSRQTEALF